MSWVDSDNLKIINSAKSTIPFFYRIYSLLVRPIRLSKLINLLLFGFCPGDKNYYCFWDWTTLNLKKVIKEVWIQDMSFLDVGTGPYGILPLYINNRLKGKSVAGCDHSEELINNAMKQPGCDNITFTKSDLFENIAGQFDLITFNTPYIEKEFGEKIGVLKDSLSLTRWAGGVRTIEKFIDEVHLHLTATGFCLLGVNNFYLADEMIKSIIRKNTCIQCVKHYKNKITKSCVYVLKRK